MVTRAELKAFFEPRTFALVGASDKSTFSNLVYRNLVAAGHGNATYLVNPRTGEVHGRPTYPTCMAVGRPIDLAFVMVPAAAAVDTLRDAAAAGAHGVVVLSAGFAEAGEEGRQRQRQLVKVAEDLGIVLLGPNLLGFVNVAARVPAMALAHPPAEPGNVALVSQSGASCGAMKDFAALAGVGLSHVMTVGNEAMVTVGHVVDHLVDDDQTEAIAVFMEGIRQPEVFAAAAQRAAAAGKAVVVLKAGRSELAARAAASHTGALVGDDRVVDAVFERLGVIRVDTIEDMLVTAGVAAHTGPLERPGIGVVSISGGACEVVAELAQQAGAVLPELAEPTVEHLTAVMPAYGHVQNPLDITGAAIIDPTIWQASVAAVGNDPGVGVLVTVNSLPWREDGQPFYGQRYVDAIGAGMSEAKVPGVYLTQVTQPIVGPGREVLNAGGVAHVVPGLRLGIDALARVARWSGRRALAGDDATTAATARDIRPVPYSEVDARTLLEAAGVPVVPARHVHSGADAARAADELGGAVVMKIVSADIAHKSDLGAVRLGVSAVEAAQVYDEIIAACGGAAADGARLHGVLVSPLRADALELLVGVTRDPDWGLMLAVGIGGVLVEVLDRPDAAAGLAGPRPKHAGEPALRRDAARRTRTARSRPGPARRGGERHRPAGRGSRPAPGVARGEPAPGRRIRDRGARRARRLARRRHPSRGGELTC